VTGEASNPALSDIVGSVVARSLARGHQHHRACIHNMPPEEQVQMRGRTVESWLAIHDRLPTQITPADWTVEPPFDEDALRRALS
jgi:hypothetical protein